MATTEEQIDKKTEESKLSDEELNQIDKIIEENQGEEGILINVLHKVQKIVGYLPREIQIRVATGLDIPFSKVYSVVSFYSLFSTTPRGKYTIEICTGTACYVKGAEEVLKRIKDELKIEPGETTEDNLFTLETARCIGACGMAPVVVVGDDVHGRIEPDKVSDLLNQYR
ncbi:NADH-quinone oxidoreductase subunit NuoE [Selenihalanaerobacter shriftii]|uniref:NAD(P)-dependent iron-only hydrogenase diaphorase component iron-sulfur protein n=1 Tax=Selenihalanaerobacter shriftii TaxID=142842 RepID=A0A1T4JQC0_9FIRM|nr:NADH-quinone oxidoreductase subunit NuoE [Selenihalanaerobacter shriftii]SJZ32319.1 NAD(P)-dependent iron-only hydrogenase diaphorase component iron-sulfur protein [Selenihalanaerobacter shriftii]